MISIYELRLRYLFARHVDPNDLRMFDFLLLDSGRAALYFLFAYLKKHRGIEDVYVNLYTTGVVHDTLRQVGCRIHPIDIDPLNFWPRLCDATDFRGYAFLHTGLFGFPSFDEEVLQRVKRGDGVFVEDSCNSFGCRIAHKEVRFDEEFRQKREVSDLLRRKLEKYPVYIYANDPDSYRGWNCLFFSLLLERGDPESFVSYLRRHGFDATRFHHEVPQKSFPNLDG